jgi:hypothetical protein
MAPYPSSQARAGAEFLTDVFGNGFMDRLQRYVDTNIPGGPALYNSFLYPTGMARCRYICFVKLPAKDPSLYEAFKSVLTCIRAYNCSTASASAPIKTLLIQSLNLPVTASSARAMARAYRYFLSSFSLPRIYADVHLVPAKCSVLLPSFNNISAKARLHCN